MVLEAGSRLGVYEIVSPIGAGGMGEVYRARDTKLKREVAIKVLPRHLADIPASLARFEREAQAVAALSHPNVLAIFDFNTVQGVTFAVTELLEGMTLRSRLSSGALPVSKAIDAALQVAHGLAATHDKGIVHRDLKPENLFVTREGRVKILDFGLASIRVFDMADPQDALTSPMPLRPTVPGVVMGTVGYMSPEQVRGEEADARSDIFSLGAVLYEMLLGVRAFEGQSKVEALSAILKEDPREIARAEQQLPRVLVRIVRRCLEKSRDERFQSALDLAYALDALSELKVETAPAPERSASPSIAVLPFANMSADPENEYFSDGITEEIISALTQLKGLKVAARISSFSFKGRNEDLRTIGEKLGVTTVLEGSVRKSGGRLRITAQLVSVRDGYHLWSERYDREVSDVFAIQDEIATAIANRLKVSLETEKVAVKPAQSLEAYELYLKGRFFWSKGGEGLKKAREYFERALAIDRDCAPAHSGLADTYGLLGWFGFVRPREAMPKAKASAERALAINESLDDAHAALGFVRMTYEWDWPEAEKLFLRAVAINPCNVAARYLRAFLLILVSGRFGEAVEEARRAVRLDPLAPRPTLVLGLILLLNRRYTELTALMEELLEREPNSFLAHRYVAIAYLSQSMSAEAIAEFETALHLSGRHPWVVAELAAAYATMRRLDEAHTLHRELVERSRREYVSGWARAHASFHLGRTDEGFGFLEEGYREREPALVAMKYWPGFDIVRDDPRFVQLLKHIGLD
jgi:serine/threonine-protein kinase